MSIRDLVSPIPKSRKELTDYVTGNYSHIQAAVESDPKNLQKLEGAIAAAVDKYAPYLGGLAQKLGSASRVAIGTATEAWTLSTGDVVGALGGKFLNLLAQIPEKLIAAPIYAVKTGNYLDAAQNMIEGAISYLPVPIPGFTATMDQGLARIVQKRILTEAMTNFEKEVGIYKPWTTRLAERLSGVYNGVKDRIDNVIRPDYEPTPALQPA